MDAATFGELTNPKLAKLERRIHSAMCGFVDAGEAFAAIRDDPAKLYSKFGTFDDYCRERWNLGRSQVYRLIDAAMIARRLSSVPGPKLEYEAQARELAGLEPNQEIEVWLRASELAKSSGRPRATSVEIRKARREVISPKVIPPKSTKMSPDGDISVPQRGTATDDSNNDPPKTSAPSDPGRSRVSPDETAETAPRGSGPGSSPTGESNGEQLHEDPLSKESWRREPSRDNDLFHGDLFHGERSRDETSNSDMGHSRLASESDFEISHIKLAIDRFALAHNVAGTPRHQACQDSLQKLEEDWEALKRSVG